MLSIGNTVIGMVVDAASDVITLAPELSGSIDSNSVLALGSVGTRLLILLDIEQAMISISPAVHGTALH